MATNYSANDTLRGNKTWGLPICLALAAGLLIGGIKYINSQRNYQPAPEIRAVQSRESQDFCSRNPRDLARLVDKYRGGDKMTQRPRYEIWPVSQEEIDKRLEDFVNRGEFPGSDYQKSRPEITRNFHFPRKFLNYLLRKK